eukprot:SM000007S20934  [mRNA]  locus=s7:1050385:1052297:- [translate_table: standard]
MVDQSELPFRMLCRRHGAHAAYTPMLHSRLFASDAKYRRAEFSTCPEDRPLFVQFCANDPQTLLAAAKHVENDCDYIDINLGCPQRIAKRGYYGAFLMDNMPLVRSLVETLAAGVSTPVSCKIRLFPQLEDTIAYAKMLEDAGCSLLAVHGRTRDQKCGRAVRADWPAICAVRQAVSIPVLANGNVRWLEDAVECMRFTGAQGVMSAESLLSNPALFAGHRMPAESGSSIKSVLLQEGRDTRPGTPCEAPDASAAAAQTQVLNSEPCKDQTADVSAAVEVVASQVEGDEHQLDGSERNGSGAGEAAPDQLSLMAEYLDLCDPYPVPMRMIRAHMHKLLGSWFRVHTDLRERLNREHKLSLPWLHSIVVEIRERNSRDPSLRPLSEKMTGSSTAPGSLGTVEHPGATSCPKGSQTDARPQQSLEFSSKEGLICGDVLGSSSASAAATITAS